jgi:hypothetical protein
VLLVGCGGATAMKIGTHRYEIHAEISPKGSADEEFNEKAREVCPDGYKILTKNIFRTNEGIASAVGGTKATAFTATIECE